MFGILIVDIMFFAIPILLLGFLGISIYRYALARKKNKTAPGAFSTVEINRRKIVLIIAAILTGTLLAVVVGVITLIFLAVAFM